MIKLTFAQVFALFALLACDLKFCLAKRARVIKSPTDATVYTFKAGVKHVIPDWNTFVSLGYDVSNIETLPAAEIAAIPTGDTVGLIKEEPTAPNPLFNCPCVSRAAYQASIAPDENSHKPHLICFIDSPEAKHLLTIYDHHMLKIHHKVIASNSTEVYTYAKVVTGTAEMDGCDVVVNIVADETAAANKYECPEMCKPVPITELPLNWLLNSAIEPEDLTPSLTCTMTFAELWDNSTEFSKHHRRADGSVVLSDAVESEVGSGQPRGEHEHTSAGLMLKAIVRRRIEECNERHLWTSGATHVTSDYKSIAPRKVHGLVVWVGSRDRYGLMAQQIQILRNQSIAPTFRVMGWMASEDQYDCRPGTTLCYDVNAQSGYFSVMPTTRLNMAAAGWACAQRRPLRAMAHVLLLFDPDYLLVVDDDTWVNGGMLAKGSAFDKYIRQGLNKRFEVMGQLTYGKKVTKRGFYYGGAGYLMGRPVVEALNGYVLRGPAAAADDMRDETMTRELSLFSQTWKLARGSCKSCMRLQNGTSAGQLVGAAASMDARVVEVCANIMSQEHTCYHSDHAISRCLVHGVNAFPLNIQCLGGTMVDPSKGVLVAMCMGTDICTERAHLTCHRWFPSPQDPFIAEPQYHVRKRRLDLQTRP